MSSLRPGTASRLLAQQQQQKQSPPATNVGGRPIGTATRLTTAGMRGGAGLSLAQSLRVEDRPITQQGVGGLKVGTGARGSRRNVEDKSYYIGLLRGKLNELSVEIGSMNRQIKDAEEENANYLQYEQMAEKLAQEIKNLQGEMGDYNTLVDKLTTDEDMGNVQLDCDDLKAANDRVEKSLDVLFEERSRREEQLKQFEVELQQERRLAETLISSMPQDMRIRYQEVKHLNEHLLKQMEKSQQEMDQLNIRKHELEDEVASSHMKQEAYRLYEQLRELQEKRDQLVEETELQGNPQQERERLLAKVKDDNQEIVTIDRQTKELQERLVQVEEDMRMVDQDIQDSQSDRIQKYRELKKREEQIDEFMESFERNKAMEVQRMELAQSNIVTLLERISRSMAHEGHMTQLPTASQLAQMRDHLHFKEQEVRKAQSTTEGITDEHLKLRNDLVKLEQLENKLLQDRATYKERLVKMEAELDEISDVEKVKREGGEKFRRMTAEKEFLSERRSHMKRLSQKLSKEYDALNKQLQENDTHNQLTTLERKWTHLEQNNFVMKEFIAGKSAETDYESVGIRVQNLMADMNMELVKGLGRKAHL